MGILLRAAICALALPACREQPTDTSPAILEIDGAPRLELPVGSRYPLHARVLNASGKRVSGVPVSWSTSDSTVATITPEGELRLAVSYTACRWVPPGDCRVQVTATSAGLQASVDVTVLPYDAQLELATHRIDLQSGELVSAGASVRLEQLPVPWCQLRYTSSNSLVADASSGAGFILAGDPGTAVVTITALGRGCPAESATLLVVVRLPLHTLTILPEGDITLAPGDSIQLTAEVRNWKGVVYTAPFVSWTSSHPEIVTVREGVARVSATTSCSADPCLVTITATSGRLVATHVIRVRD